MNNTSGAILLICAIACALGSLRAASADVVDLMLFAVYAILVAVAIPATRRRSDRRWMTAAILGWAYFLPVFVFASPPRIKRSPTNVFLEFYVSRLLPLPTPPPGFGLTPINEEWPLITYDHTPSTRVSPPKEFVSGISSYNKRASNAIKMGHLWITLFLAALPFLPPKCRRRPSS